jgi:hypothetical protein
VIEDGMTPAMRRAQRVLDVLGALVLLGLLAPLLPLLALLIKLDSRGPLLEWHAAVGVQRRRPRPADGPCDPRRLHDMGGVLLWLPELRTTQVPRERSLQRDVTRPIEGGEGVGVGPGAGPGADPGVGAEGEPHPLTRVGRWLLRTRLAGWPRAWSVLRGDLALVGPRALDPRCVARMRDLAADWDAGMRDIRPGLFGPAQAARLRRTQPAAGAGPAMGEAISREALRDRLGPERDFVARLRAARSLLALLALQCSALRVPRASVSRARVAARAAATLPLTPPPRPQCAAHDAPLQPLRPR